MTNGLEVADWSRPSHVIYHCSSTQLPDLGELYPLQMTQRGRAAIT